MEDADKPPQNFDPDFASPVEGAELPAIIISSDKVGFHADLKVLASRSSFCQDLSEIPMPEVEEGQKPRVLPFPSASSPAIKFVLQAVAYNLAHPPQTSSPAGEPASEQLSKTALYEALPDMPQGIKLLQEILHFTDAYELNDFTIPVIYEAMKKAHHYSPAIMFTMTAITDQGNLSHWATRILSEGGKGAIDPWSNAMLETNASERLPELYALFDRWDTAFANFKKASSGAPIDGKNAFSKECITRQCACVAEFDGNWAAFTSSFRDKMYKYALASPMLMKRAKVMEFCMKSVACESCAKRLAPSISSAWNRSVTRQAWSLNPGKANSQSSHVRRRYRIVYAV